MIRGECRPTIIHSFFFAFAGISTFSYFVNNTFGMDGSIA
jgi:hypothetical protein